MPRQRRSDVAGVIYHALNRGNRRMRIFEKEADYEAFIRVLHEGLAKYSVELFAFTLMPNHWHLVLRPGKDGECVDRGRPFGEQSWVEQTSEKHGLGYTMRPLGRPNRVNNPRPLLFAFIRASYGAPFLAKACAILRLKVSSSH